MLPFTRMPMRLAPPMPPKKESGMLITSAHGQLMTRKVSARKIQLLHAAELPVSKRNTGGITASASAP